MTPPRPTAGPTKGHTHDIIEDEYLRSEANPKTGLHVGTWRGFCADPNCLIASAPDLKEALERLISSSARSANEPYGIRDAYGHLTQLGLRLQGDLAAARKALEGL